MSTVQIHSGKITSSKDKSGNTIYLAESDLEKTGISEPTTFWTFGVASWFLEVIEARINARKFRMGSSYAPVRD